MNVFSLLGKQVQGRQSRVLSFHSIAHSAWGTEGSRRVKAGWQTECFPGKPALLRRDRERLAVLWAWSQPRRHHCCVLKAQMTVSSTPKPRPPPRSCKLFRQVRGGWRPVPALLLQAPAEAAPSGGKACLSPQRPKVPWLFYAQDLAFQPHLRLFSWAHILAVAVAGAGHPPPWFKFPSQTLWSLFCTHLYSSIPLILCHTPGQTPTLSNPICLL